MFVYLKTKIYSPDIRKFLVVDDMYSTRLNMEDNCVPLVLS